MLPRSVFITIAVFSHVLGESSKPQQISIRLQVKSGYKVAKVITEGIDDNELRRGTVLEKLVRSDIYVGDILLGTPGQRVSVEFDTGSSFLWVKSSTACAKYHQICENDSSYNHSKSETYQSYGKNFTINYVTGFATGAVVRDDISIAGLKIKGQLFGEATDFDQKLYSVPDYSGIFGMGFFPDQMPVIYKIDPPLKTMIKQNVTDKPIYCFYISRTKEYAQLDIGRVDNTKYTGKFFYIKNAFISTWGVKIEKILICKRKIADIHYAVVDTGATVLAGPINVIKTINTAFGAKYSIFQKEYSSYTYYIECNRTILPTITFIIDNNPFSIPGTDIKLEKRDPKNDLFCETSIVAYDDVGDIYFGTPFFQNYYVQYDLEKMRLGFARSV